MEIKISLWKHNPDNAVYKKNSNYMMFVSPVHDLRMYFDGIHEQRPYFEGCFLREIRNTSLTSPIRVCISLQNLVFFFHEGLR